MGRWRTPGVQSWTTAANTLFFAALEPVGRRVGSARNAPRSPPWLWLGLARVLQTASVHFVPMSWRALAGLSMTGSHPKLTAQASAPHEAFARLYKFASVAVQNLIARACPRRETIRQAASLFDNAAQHPSRTSRQLRHTNTQIITVMGQPAYRKALLLCLVAAAGATKVSERKWKAAADEALAAFKPIRKSVNSCVEIKILRRVRPESSRRPPRHRRDACSSLCWCRFLAARPSQDDRVIAKKWCTRRTG